MKIVLKNEQEYDTMKAEKMDLFLLRKDLFLLRKNGYTVAGMIFFHINYGYFMVDMEGGISFTRMCGSPSSCVEAVLEKGYEIIKVIDNADLELVEV